MEESGKKYMINVPLLVPMRNTAYQVAARHSKKTALVFDRNSSCHESSLQLTEYIFLSNSYCQVESLKYSVHRISGSRDRVKHPENYLFSLI